MSENPILVNAAAAAANPGFRVTSFLEFVAGLTKQFLDTPEERATVKAGLMVIYDTVVTPRAPVVAKLARPFVEQFVDTTLATLGS